jgi:hypothetical protein
VYITQEHNKWPRTVPRIAARLRQVLALPGLSVTTRHERLSITWIGGPPADPVYAELRHRLGGVVSYRAVRLYPVAPFGAALLMTYQPPSDDRQFRDAWSLLSKRDLTDHPLDETLVGQGAVLAAIAGAPATAVVGWGRRRWDWHMWQALQQFGDSGVLEAVCAPAAP